MKIKPYDVDWDESFADPIWTEHELRYLRHKIDNVLKAMERRRG